MRGIRFKLALSVISGRKNSSNMSQHDFVTLGVYDSFGISDDELKDIAENIVFDIIGNIVELFEEEEDA